MNKFMQGVLLPLFFLVLLHSSPRASTRPGPVSGTTDAGRSEVLLFARAQPIGFPGVSITENQRASYGQLFPDYTQYTHPTHEGLRGAEHYWWPEEPSIYTHHGFELQNSHLTSTTQQQPYPAHTSAAQQYADQFLSSIKEHYIGNGVDPHDLGTLPEDGRQQYLNPELQLEYATRLHLAQQQPHTQPQQYYSQPLGHLQVENGTPNENPLYDEYYTSDADPPHVQYTHLPTTPEQHPTEPEVHVPELQHYTSEEQNRTAILHHHHRQLHRPEEGSTQFQQHSTNYYPETHPQQHYSGPPDATHGINHTWAQAYVDQVQPTLNQQSAEQLNHQQFHYTDYVRENHRAEDRDHLVVDHSQPWHDYSQHANNSRHPQGSYLHTSDQGYFSGELHHPYERDTPQHPYPEHVYTQHQQYNPGPADHPQVQYYDQQPGAARFQNYRRSLEQLKPQQQPGTQAYNTAGVDSAHVQLDENKVQFSSAQQHYPREIHYPQQYYKDKAIISEELRSSEQHSAAPAQDYIQQIKELHIDDNPYHEDSSGEQLETPQVYQRRQELRTDLPSVTQRQRLQQGGSIQPHSTQQPRAPRELHVDPSHTFPSRKHHVQQAADGKQLDYGTSYYSESAQIDSQQQGDVRPRGFGRAEEVYRQPAEQQRKGQAQRRLVQLKTQQPVADTPPESLRSTQPQQDHDLVSTEDDELPSDTPEQKSYDGEDSDSHRQQAKEHSDGPQSQQAGTREQDFTTQQLEVRQGVKSKGTLQYEDVTPKETSQGFSTQPNLPRREDEGDDQPQQPENVQREVQQADTSTPQEVTTSSEELRLREAEQQEDQAQQQYGLFRGDGPQQGQTENNAERQAEQDDEDANTHDHTSSGSQNIEVEQEGAAQPQTDLDDEPSPHSLELTSTSAVFAQDLDPYETEGHAAGDNAAQENQLEDLSQAEDLEDEVATAIEAQQNPQDDVSQVEDLEDEVTNAIETQQDPVEDVSQVEDLEDEVANAIETQRDQLEDVSQAEDVENEVANAVQDLPLRRSSSNSSVQIPGAAIARRLDAAKPVEPFDYYAALDQQERQRYPEVSAVPVRKQDSSTGEQQNLGDASIKNDKQGPTEVAGKQDFHGSFTHLKKEGHEETDDEATSSESDDSESTDEETESEEEGDEDDIEYAANQGTLQQILHDPNEKKGGHQDTDSEGDSSEFDDDSDDVATDDEEEEVDDDDESEESDAESENEEEGKEVHPSVTAKRDTTHVDLDTVNKEEGRNEEPASETLVPAAEKGEAAEQDSKAVVEKQNSVRGDLDDLEERAADYNEAGSETSIPGGDIFKADAESAEVVGRKPDTTHDVDRVVKEKEGDKKESDREAAVSATGTEEANAQGSTSEAEKQNTTLGGLDDLEEQKEEQKEADSERSTRESDTSKTDAQGPEAIARNQETVQEDLEKLKEEENQHKTHSEAAISIADAKAGNEVVDQHVGSEEATNDHDKNGDEGNEVEEEGTHESNIGNSSKPEKEQEEPSETKQEVNSFLQQEEEKPTGLTRKVKADSDVPTQLADQSREGADGKRKSDPAVEEASDQQEKETRDEANHLGEPVVDLKGLQKENSQDTEPSQQEKRGLAEGKDEHEKLRAGSSPNPEDAEKDQHEESKDLPLTEVVPSEGEQEAEEQKGEKPADVGEHERSTQNSEHAQLEDEYLNRWGDNRGLQQEPGVGGEPQTDERLNPIEAQDGALGGEEQQKDSVPSELHKAAVVPVEALEKNDLSEVVADGRNTVLLDKTNRQEVWNRGENEHALGTTLEQEGRSSDSHPKDEPYSAEKAQQKKLLTSEDRLERQEEYAQSEAQKEEAPATQEDGNEKHVETDHKKETAVVQLLNPSAQGEQELRAEASKVEEPEERHQEGERADTTEKTEETAVEQPLYTSAQREQEPQAEGLEEQDGKGKEEEEAHASTVEKTGEIAVEQPPNTSAQGEQEPQAEGSIEQDGKGKEEAHASTVGKTGETAVEQPPNTSAQGEQEPQAEGPIEQDGKGKEEEEAHASTVEKTGEIAVEQPPNTSEQGEQEPQAEGPKEQGAKERHDGEAHVDTVNKEEAVAEQPQTTAAQGEEARDGEGTAAQDANESEEGGVRLIEVDKTEAAAAQSENTTAHGDQGVPAGEATQQQANAGEGGVQRYGAQALAQVIKDGINSALSEEAERGGKEKRLTPEEWFKKQRGIEKEILVTQETEREKHVNAAANGEKTEAEQSQNTSVNGVARELAREGSQNKHPFLFRHEEKNAINPFFVGKLEQDKGQVLWLGHNGEVTENPPFDSLPSHTAGETTSPEAGVRRRQSPLSWAVKEDKNLMPDKEGEVGKTDGKVGNEGSDSDEGERYESLSSAVPSRASPEATTEDHAVAAHLLPQVPGLLFPAGDPSRPVISSAEAEKPALTTKERQNGHDKSTDVDRDTPSAVQGERPKPEEREKKAQFPTNLKIFRGKVDHEEDDALFGSNDGALDPIAYSTLPPGAAASRHKRHGRKKRAWKLTAAARAVREKETSKETAEPGTTKPPNAHSGARTSEAAVTQKSKVLEDLAGKTKRRDSELDTKGRGLNNVFRNTLAYQAAKAAAAGGKEGSDPEPYLLLPRQSERIAAAEVTTATGIPTEDVFAARTVDQALHAEVSSNEGGAARQHMRQRHVGPTVGPGPTAFLPQLIYRPSEEEAALPTGASALDVPDLHDLSADLAPHVDEEPLQVVREVSVRKPEARPGAAVAPQKSNKVMAEVASHRPEYEEPVSAGAALTNSRLASTLSQQTAAAEQARAGQQQRGFDFAKGGHGKQNDEGIEGGEEVHTEKDVDNLIEEEGVQEFPFVKKAEPSNRNAALRHRGAEAQPASKIPKKSAGFTNFSVSQAAVSGPLLTIGWLLLISL